MVYAVIDEATGLLLNLIVADEKDVVKGCLLVKAEGIGGLDIGHTYWSKEKGFYPSPEREAYLTARKQYQDAENQKLIDSLKSGTSPTRSG